MNSPTIFREYIWLVNVIYRNGKLSLAEINDKWKQTDMSGGRELARTTFNRHRESISDIFGIDIQCDVKAGYKYYIHNGRALRENSIQNWMFSTLSVNNIIGESLSLQNRILLETIPSDNDWLQMILEAMKKNLMIRVSYLKYGAEETKTQTFAPYCIKLWKKRWYLLARMQSEANAEVDKGHLSDGHDAVKESESDHYRVYSFDRMRDVEITDRRFDIDPAFSAEDIFGECYGVIAGDGTQCRRVVLRAYGTNMYYVRDLPLHQSQRMLKATDEYADFEYFIRPTVDFKNHILSHGNRLKVLSPPELAEDIKDMHRKAMEMY